MFGIYCYDYIYCVLKSTFVSTVLTDKRIWNLKSVWHGKSLPFKFLFIPYNLSLNARIHAPYAKRAFYSSYFKRAKK